MANNHHRVQFVISGWSLGFLVLCIGSWTSAFWLYTHRRVPQSPPYFVSHTATAARPCFQCIALDGKMKESKEWKLGKAIEIPADKPAWFAPVEAQAVSERIDGVPMLAVHPAIDNDKPWFGFDQRRVYFVVFQDVEARFSIDHPAPPPPAPEPAAPVSPSPEPPSGSSPPPPSAQ